jgi:hypothetical protein
MTVNAPITVNITGNGTDAEAQIQRAMRQSTADLIRALRKAEKEDFRSAIV